MILPLAAPVVVTAPATPEPGLRMEAVGRVQLGPYNSGAAEIVAWHPGLGRAFVTNAHTNAIDMVSLGDPTRPDRVGSIDLSHFGGGVNSVAVHGDLVAAAVEGFVKQDPGRVVLFNAAGEFLSLVEVGCLPDMLTFTPDGRSIVIANEGEPNADYSVDPEGSVTIIDLPEDHRRLGQRHARTVDFRRFNGETIDHGVRTNGPGASIAQDLEPEYIAVSPDSSTAFVVLQENNAMAIIDLPTATVSALVPLGTHDHSLPGHGIDASDRDGLVRISNWPVKGLFQPDTVRCYDAGGQTYIVCADEGDVRSYGNFTDEARVADLVLDPAAFPDAAYLQRAENLGRLKVARDLGDHDGDGDYDELFTFGGRSLTIRDDRGRLVYCSGDTLEVLTAAAMPAFFNNDSVPDARSDDRGPEPEALTLGTIAGRTYAFLGLERASAIAVFDITDPAAARPVGVWTTRTAGGVNELGTGGDIAPEGMAFVPADQSPTGKPLLLVANELSGTLTVWCVEPVAP